MVTGMITAIVVARALGPSVYGVLGFGVAVLSYLGLLVNMGMDVHGVREIARNRDLGYRLVGMIVSTRLIFAFVLFAGLVAAAPYFGWSETVRLVLMIQGVGLFGVALTLDFFYQAEQRMAVAALRQGGAAIAGVVAVVLFVNTPEDVFIAAAVPVAVHVLSALLLIAYFRVRVAARPAPAEPISRLGFLARSAPVALMAVLTTIYVNLDIILLGYMVPEAEVGLYVAASRVAMIALVFPNLIHSAFLPALSKALGDDAAANAAATNHARSVMFFGGAVGGGGMLLAPAIVEILFGPAYAGAGFAMTILMAHVLVSHLTAAFGTPLLAWQCDKPFTVILAAGAFVNIVLNLIMIPLYGIEGAAIATVITQILVWIGLMVLARKAFNLCHHGLIVRFAAATSISMAAVWATIEFSTISAYGPWAVMIACGTIYLLVYSGLAIATGLTPLVALSRLTRRGD